MYIKCIIGVGLVALSNFLYAQNNEKLKERLNGLLLQQHLSGAIWTTVMDEGKIITDAVGYKNNQTKELLSSTDKVLVGSVAKTILSAGFLRMATIGLINLNDPIKKYLPELPLKNKWEKSNPVTIKNLLDHTSGLTDVKLWQVFSTTASSKTPLDYVYTNSPEVLRVQTRPGSIYSYSNVGYNILGKIIEVVSKKPYEEFLYNELLLPLGMTNSSFSFSSQMDNKQLAFGHFDDGLPVCAIPMYLRAAGQFVTTAADMGRFLQFMMSDGKINNSQFISKEYLRSVGKQTATDAFINGVPYGDALGAYSRDRYGVVGIAKNGNTLGFVSMIYMFPEYQKGFFITFNMDSETSDYDLFNELLVKHLALPVKPCILKTHNVENKLKNWDGYYIPVITKVEPYGLIDMVFSHSKLTILKTGARLSPFQGKQKSLLYQGDNLFSMNDRTGISHAFYRDVEGAYLITDGVKTIKKVSGAKIFTTAGSLILGLSGILYLFIVGIVHLFKNKGAFIQSPLFWIFLSIIVIVIAAFFIANQGFIRMGDFTIGNILLAIGSMILPLFAFVSVILQIKLQDKYYLKVSFWASIVVLQWCLLLLANNLLPIILWK
ncbi:MAG: serine hydrolase [Flavihumibacter sp.]|nr:serine hydrolase [Flavihumibacter sp.]